jgi:hypothetical protein
MTVRFARRQQCHEFKDGEAELTRPWKPFFNNNFDGKAVGIDVFICKHPCAAFGNSTGDREMLEYTRAGNGAQLKMPVAHANQGRIDQVADLLC